MRATGRSPSDCYLQMRLDQAELMLKRTRHSIAAVAAATGSCDFYHLSRVFKELRGTTPVRARRTQGQGPGVPA